jgi:uncharacterized protein (TIGR03083 family)
MNELATEHERLRTELTALLRSLGPDTVADTPVPACPAWTVRHVIAHLAGVGDDILAGRLDGVATDAWTQAQVDARSDRTLDEILEEWETTDPQVEAMSDAFGEVQAQWLFDCATHDADVRGALGEPVTPLAPEAMAAALDFLARNHLLVFTGTDQPVPHLLAGGKAVLAPDADPNGRLGPATAATAPFELMRGLSGRRSLDQLRSWDWSDDPEPYLGAFTWGPFTVRPTSLAV